MKYYKKNVRIYIKFTEDEKKKIQENTDNMSEFIREAVFEKINKINNR